MLYIASLLRIASLFVQVNNNKAASPANRKHKSFPFTLYIQKCKIYSAAYSITECPSKQQCSNTVIR